MIKILNKSYHVYNIFFILLFSFRNYIGFLDDGSCFDNSYKRGQALYFILGAEQVIPAWEEVLPILSRGEKARIVVPPEVSIEFYT